MKRNFRTFDPKVARVILLDAVDTVLPPFPEPLQRRARRDLERLGVEVRLGTRVTGVDVDGLRVESLDGSVGRIEAYTKIWAAGVQASALGLILAEQSGAEVDRAGRVQVLPDCSLPGHPEVFVVGDLMSLDRLPGVAEVAMQSGRHAARTIVRRLRSDADLRPFRYRDLGTMARCHSNCPLVAETRNDVTPSSMSPPRREADRLLQRIRTLVREDRRCDRARSIELEERAQEIERLKTQLAEVVKRTAGR